MEFNNDILNFGSFVQKRDILLFCILQRQFFKSEKKNPSKLGEQITEPLLLKLKKRQTAMILLFFKMGFTSRGLLCY